MDGDSDGEHLTLKQQWQLMDALVRGKPKSRWDQEAADRLGGYMLDNGIRSMALRGYYAEISDAGLYVAEAPVEKYGVAAYLHYEYLDGRAPVQALPPKVVVRW